jgi:cold shock protein
MEDESEVIRCKGKVVWFQDQKGYGFIRADGLGDVFCHFSAIKNGVGRRSLQKDQRVELVVVKGPKGLMAAEVEVTI